MQVGASGGLLLSTGLVTIISGVTTKEQFLEWGWRIPFLANLSDRIGRRKVFIFGAVAGVVLAYPFWWGIQTTTPVLIWLVSVLAINLSHDPLASVQQPLFTELFGPRSRYSGAGVAYQLASALGGFTSFIAAALVAAADHSWTRHVVQLGAGGAGAAIAHAMLRFGVERLTVVDSAPERARELAGALGRVSAGTGPTPRTWTAWRIRSSGRTGSSIRHRSG